MSLGENSLVAAYQGKGQWKIRPSGTRVVTVVYSKFLISLYFGKIRTFPILEKLYFRPTFSNVLLFLVNVRDLTTICVVPPILTMMHLCIIHCTYWTPLGIIITLIQYLG